MYCPQCGCENPDDAKFCIGCRHDLSGTRVGGKTVGRRDTLDSAVTINRDPAKPAPENTILHNKTLDSAPTIVSDRVFKGAVLCERYEVQERIGGGGMGEVFKARDRHLDAIVAIKVLPAVLCRNERSIANLKKEAAVSLKLTHPNICRLYNFEEDSVNSISFLVMEYIQGKTLQDMLHEREDKKMSHDELLPIAKQIAAALDYAHALNPPVVHRDIKPANIMVATGGTAKLLDFGIAREIKDSVTMVTGHYDTSGTLAYMSPEQFQGKKLTSASDVYSFASVLYEALAGRPLISPHGDPAWQISAVLTDDPDNSEAKSIQQKIEQAGDLDAVVKIKVKAKNAYEEAQKLDPANGFREKLHSLKLSYEIAEEFYKKESYARALSEYQNLMDECKRLQDLNKARITAIHAKELCDSAKKQAVDAKADIDAKSQFDSAEKLYKSALASLKAGDFISVSQKFNKSQREYLKLIDYLAKSKKYNALKLEVTNEKDKALKVNANIKVPKVFLEADAFYKQANEAIIKAEWDFVESKFLDAKTKYHESMLEAIKISSLEKARANWQSDWSKVDSTTRKKLEKYGGAKYQKLCSKITGTPTISDYAEASKLLPETLEYAEACYNKSEYESVMSQASTLISRIPPKASERVLDDLNNTQKVIELCGFALKIKPNDENALKLKASANRLATLGIDSEDFVILDLNIKMVWVAAGSFDMGSAAGEKDEMPLHRVNIKDSFWISQKEITNEEYEKFLLETGYEGKGDSDEDYLRHYRDWGKYAPVDKLCPIVCISWNNAKFFCKWLTQKEHSSGQLPKYYEYRLPTEAQWEYAARRGNKSKNHIDKRDGANEFVVYGMTESVSEWCEDKWHANYHGAPTDGTMWDNVSNSRHIIRGRSVNEYGNKLTYRYSQEPEYTDRTLGFRIVLAFIRKKRILGNTNGGILQKSLHENNQVIKHLAKLTAKSKVATMPTIEQNQRMNIVPIIASDKDSILKGWPGKGMILKGGMQRLLQNIANSNVNISNINLMFSSDGGKTWSILIEHIRPFGISEWTVPVVSSDKCYIKLVGTDNLGRDNMLVISEQFTVIFNR